MNSVETFAHVPVIAERGAEWWKAQGVNGGTGLKFFAVSGHVEKPDVYCVPMGTTARELIELAGGVTEGRELLAFQPGGASSNFLGPDRLDVPLDFEPLADAGSMLGSGALVVVAEGTDLLAAATNVLRFFRNESCGKCVPVPGRIEQGARDPHRPGRVGRGASRTWTRRIIELEETMRLTSICGLGQVALGPAISVLGLKRGGTEAREQPRPGPDTDHETDPGLADGRRRPDRRPRAGESLRRPPVRWRRRSRASRPARRTPVEPVALDDARGRVPAEPVARRTPAGLRARDRRTASRCAPRTPTARRRGCPATSTSRARCAMGRRPR